MCGIVGYIGSKHNGISVVLDGLQSLEYRGYDSAGIAFLDTKHQGHVVKQVGPVANVRTALSSQSDGADTSTLTIGHTRWATHGLPNTLNAHPHYNTDRTIFVVHNGIIENYALLRKKLEDKGYTFLSQTDTEVIP